MPELYCIRLQVVRLWGNLKTFYLFDPCQSKEDNGLFFFSLLSTKFLKEHIIVYIIGIVFFKHKNDQEKFWLNSITLQKVYCFMQTNDQAIFCLTMTFWARGNFLFGLVLDLCISINLIYSLHHQITFLKSFRHF